MQVQNNQPLFIKGNEKDNNIIIERKDNSTDVTIDGIKNSYDGNPEIIVNAGAGNDNITISNLPQSKNNSAPITIFSEEGKDKVFAEGNIKINKKSNTNIEFVSSNSKADFYASQIETVLNRKNPTLSVEDKKEVLDILKRSQNDKSITSLVEKLDKNGKLENLYKDMGTLVNQGSGGAVASSVLTVFTLGLSLVSEAKANNSFEMKQILKDSNVSNKILDKLK